MVKKKNLCGETISAPFNQIPFIIITVIKKRRHTYTYA